MFEIKIERMGISMAIVLPDEVADQLNARRRQTLYLIETPDGGYRLTPNAVATYAEDVLHRYRNTQSHGTLAK